jgi:hypothetical protein
METLAVNLCETEWMHVLEDTAAEILKLASVKRPPVNAIELAQRLGYRVLWDEQQTGRARIATVRAGPARPSQSAIFLRPDPRPERIQWAVAHEIGEQYAAVVSERLGIEANGPENGRREQIANLLATRLLLPAAWFSRDAVAFDFDLVQLKINYPTASHELIARRFLDLGRPVLVTIFDHGKPQFRRWNLPRRPPAISPDEWDAWRHAHQTGEAVRCCGPARIDVWPIHEPGWKREIIRLELPADPEEFQQSELANDARLS